MSSFKTFDIAGSGMSAQSVRLNTTASNLANADSVSGDPNQVYKASIRSSKRCARARPRTRRRRGVPPCACAASSNRRRRAAARYEPGNPLADAKGYVYAPDVNMVEEMVDMISASRSYQNNVEVMNTVEGNDARHPAARPVDGCTSEHISTWHHQRHHVRQNAIRKPRRRSAPPSRRSRRRPSSARKTSCADDHAAQEPGPAEADGPAQFLGQLAQFGTVSGHRGMQEQIGALTASLRCTRCSTARPGRPRRLAPGDDIYLPDAVRRVRGPQGLINVPAGASAVQLASRFAAARWCRRRRSTASAARSIHLGRHQRQRRARPGRRLRDRSDRQRRRRKTDRSKTSCRGRVCRA